MMGNAAGGPEVGVVHDGEGRNTDARGKVGRPGEAANLPPTFEHRSHTLQSRVARLPQRVPQLIP